MTADHRPPGAARHLRSDVVIRPERPDDVAGIAEVVEAAFGSPAEAQLVAAIRASAEYLPDVALVAVLGGRIVGHTMGSDAVLVDGASRRRVAMLSPLAVTPEHQRHGIGSALVEAAIDRCRHRGEPVLVLEGDPAFYGRFGFEHSVPHGIRLPIPSWAPSEASQLLRLPHFDPSLQGDVVYPPAFDAFSEH